MKKHLLSLILTAFVMLIVIRISFAQDPCLSITTITHFHWLPVMAC
jgi:hypothetical protein